MKYLRNFVLSVAVIIIVINIFATTKSQIEDAFEQATKRLAQRFRLTKGGLQRHIKWRKNALCNEKHEPKWWKLWRVGRKAKHLKTCVEYDLSLRLRPLGDKGVRSLTSHLSGTEIYSKGVERHLRKLNLARQQITRRGAGYLARWISPLEDPKPAIASHIHINLEGNPISISGRKLLERAVDEARLEGIHVFITGGGPITERRRGFVMAKLGPLELSLPSSRDRE